MPVLGDAALAKLAFANHAFEAFGCAFDAVLRVIAVGRKQPHDLAFARSCAETYAVRREVERLADFELMLYH
jgi:hypothetical protein